MTDYDRTRYVVPGVPRIQADFFSRRLSDLVTGQIPIHELDLINQIEKDNLDLLEVRNLNQERIERSYDFLKLEGNKLEQIALREFLSAGSTIHITLNHAGDDRDVKLTPLGIALTTRKAVDEFKAYSRALSIVEKAFNKSSLLNKEVGDVNPIYLGALYLFAELAVPHYVITKQGKDLVLLSSAIGAQVGYDLLVGQEAEYRFKETTGGMK